MHTVEDGALPPGILGTNHVPSPEEFTYIRERLIPLHVERSLGLETEVKTATATLAALLREQRIQSELLEAHKALLTPMRRLIPDVLLEIFYHCHDQHLEAPMRLARVCHTWREIVLSTPTLWNVAMLHDTMPTRQIVPFARACSEYSGSCPIRVVFKFMRKRPNNKGVRRAMYEALEVLARHIDRWQSFEVFLDKFYSPDDGDFKLPKSAPQLEKVVMVIDPPTTLQFLHIPNLRSLRIPTVKYTDVPLLLQCTMLRELTIGGAMSELTLMNCWTILSNCPNIELFDMTSIKSDFPVPPSMEITLRCLRELRIGPFTPDPGPLMHCIKAPALQHLRMIVDRDVNFDSSCITCLVQESRPPLTILSLANMDGKDVALCLPLLPNLVSVTLQHTRAMDLVLCCLTAQDDQGRPHCPLLEHLGLRLSLFTGGHLVRFARERRKAASGLRVLVDNRSRYKPGDFAGLTIELSLVGEFTDSELKELYDLQT